MIKERKLIYNYKTDQRTANKFDNNEILSKLSLQNFLNIFKK